MDDGSGSRVEPGAAAIGDDRHVVTVAPELAGERRGGEHVPPGSPGRQNHRTLVHGRSSPMRRLVRASRRPIAKATAINDDPP